MKNLFSKYILPIIALTVGLVSCTSEVYESENGIPIQDDRIIIAAASSDMLNTRGFYQTDDDGNVKGGLFYLTFPTTASTINAPKYSRLYVDFDKAVWSEKYNGYYTYTEGRESGSELTNDLIGSVPNKLFLDNVDPIPVTSSAENDTVVKFPSENNPYAAGLMTNEKDILWGEEQKHSSSNLYNFDELHHVLAGVRIKITIDQSESIMENYDLSEAQVYLSGIIIDPVSFNRTTGDVAISNTPDYKKLYFVNTLDPDNYEGIDTPDLNEDLGWKDDDKVDDKGNPIYTTQDFILPPQNPNNDNWPELVVRFPNPYYNLYELETSENPEKPYKEFYGKLPKGMFTDYSDATNYGLDLSFLREHILEIRTQISQNPPQLVFMPVKVYNWVNWGPYTLTGNQDGIYDAEDFQIIMSYYNNYNAKMLDRYGDLTNGNWNFNIWRNLKLKESDLLGTMPVVEGRPTYSFSLNNYRVTVSDDNGQTLYLISSEQELVNLLAKGEKPVSSQPNKQP